MFAHAYFLVGRYDVWILMSDAFYEYLSEDVRALCRLCDKCTGLCNVLLPYLLQRRHRHSSFAVKGSVAPMSFYTYDVNPYPVLPSLPKNGTFWDIFPPTTTVEYAFLLTLCSAMQCIYISSGIAQNLVRVYKRILMVNGQNRNRF